MLIALFYVIYYIIWFSVILIYKIKIKMNYYINE